jgi:diamine N-acetyltransferase
MSSPRGSVPLSYRRLKRTEFGTLGTLEFDTDQLERFLGPIPDILDAVQHGLAHSVIAIEADGTLAGFFVLHPDQRNASCWWLGWLALDNRQQGRGFGTLAMQEIVERLRRVNGCRRVRLLVAPDNLGARVLYERVGFHAVGLWTSTGELVLELVLPPAIDAGRLNAFNLVAVAARGRRVFRHRRLRLTVGPHAAWVIGVERGPPAALQTANVRDDVHDGGDRDRHHQQRHRECNDDERDQIIAWRRRARSPLRLKACSIEWHVAPCPPQHMAADFDIQRLPLSKRRAVDYASASPMRPSAVASCPVSRHTHMRSQPGAPNNSPGARPTRAHSSTCMQAAVSSGQPSI